MRFDDRLMTVLSQPQGEPRDLAVRWRQLVELVARSGAGSDSPAVADALATIRADLPKVEPGVRAAAARAVAALPLPLPLLEIFATDSLAVSAPVLAAAQLDAAQWQRIAAVADAETRRFIATVHPEARVGPSPDEGEPGAPPTRPSAPPQPSQPSLHEVVERIERRRRARVAIQGAGGASAEPGLFRFECGPGGDIAWVEGAPRGALIGRSLARDRSGSLDPAVVRAFARRAPFRDARLAIGGDGPVAGNWTISAVPAFEPADGRFAGYRGIALKERPEGATGGAAMVSLTDPDSVRELVHEIKTPLNAIAGFAEIIDSELLGPADGHYRDRAREIAAQARLLLTAIDDLDIAASTHSSAVDKAVRADICELVERLTPDLQQLAGERQCSIDVRIAAGACAAAIDPRLAERLIRRFCDALVAIAEPGERLRLTLEPAGNKIRLAIGRPAALEGLDEDRLFGDSDGSFPLRMARGLARLAGAELGSTSSAIALLFRRG